MIIKQLSKTRACFLAGIAVACVIPDLEVVDVPVNSAGSSGQAAGGIHSGGSKTEPTGGGTAAGGGGAPAEPDPVAGAPSAGMGGEAGSAPVVVDCVLNPCDAEHVCRTSTSRCVLKDGLCDGAKAADAVLCDDFEGRDIDALSWKTLGTAATLSKDAAHSGSAGARISKGALIALMFEEKGLKVPLRMSAWIQLPEVTNTPTLLALVDPQDQPQQSLGLESLAFIWSNPTYGGLHRPSKAESFVPHANAWICVDISFGSGTIATSFNEVSLPTVFETEISGMASSQRGAPLLDGRSEDLLIDDFVLSRGTYSACK